MLEKNANHVSNAWQDCRATRAVAYALMMTLTLGAAGCGCGASNVVWVYVDNAEKKPMVVMLDGKEVATIEPGTFAKFECEPGRKQLKAMCGDNVIFDETKDLKKSDQFGVSRRYFFNPDNRKRYVTYVVKYGSSPFDGLVQAALEDASGNQRSAIEAAHQELLKQYEVMPDVEWFEVPAGALVLERPPDVVMTRGHTERRIVLTHVSAKDYAFLEAAKIKANPTVRDLEKLEEVVERLLDSEP
jgi:hypothetical protein